MFADEIRRAIAAASRIALPQVTAQLWRAFGDGHITEAEAERLSALIEARTLTGKPARVGSPTSSAEPQPIAAADTPQILPGRNRRSVGSHPRTDASMERRRRWAASGRLPPGLAARFTLAEQAVLALVATETCRRKDCRLAIENMAAVAGVCRSTVKNALREARRLGLISVEERAITGFRNDTNIVRVVSAEWLAWLRLARRGDLPSNRGEQSAVAERKRGGVKAVTSTTTQVQILSESRITQPSKSCRRAAGDLHRSAHPRIRQGGGKARAMR